MLSKDLPFISSNPIAGLSSETSSRPKSVSSISGSMLVNGSPAELDTNLRIAAYGMGTVVIPQGLEFPALSLYPQENLAGDAQQIICYQKNTDQAFAGLGGKAGSLVLKRGYMATLAENADGSGFSKNFVAQDHDVVIKSLPSALQEKLSFAKVFPWKWTAKKGIGGNFGEALGIAWYYNWSINSESSLNLEYVPIKQKKNWPRLTQDWQRRGSVHLLGFNEPDKKDQANMTVDEAIAGWPRLLATGLRLGSPSTSDGGLKWLYQFMDRADKEGLRVDYVAVHYYRAVPDPGDGKAAAAQFKRFLQTIHDRTKRPLWVTEWNNGARWTKARAPNPQEQKRAVVAMMEMMEETEFVERYALFNWGEPSRLLMQKGGVITPAGEAYRDLPTNIGYQQK